MPAHVIFHALWIATALRVLLPSFADPDLWGHVLFGTMLLGGSLPGVNGFAYTAAEHPWVNHEVLAEISMASVFHTAGAAGLVALKVGLGLATLLIVWRTAFHRTRDHAASGLTTAIVAVVMAPGFMIRPQIFTLLFLAATLAELAKVSYRPRGMVWLLPALFVVWINTHGGVLAGLGLAGVGIGTALAVRWWDGERRASDIAWSMLLVALLGGALLVNPWGSELIRFLVLDVTPEVPITEWAPVTMTDGSFPIFKLLLVVALVGCVTGREVRLPELAIAGIAAAAAITHQRHVPLFALAATPIIAATLADWWTRLPTPRSMRLAQGACAALALVQLGLATTSGLDGGGRIRVDPWRYPVQAMRFLVQNDIAGNVALPFRWGEYAIWSLPPGSRVAVDGRFTTAYPQPLLDSVWRFMSGEPGWEALLTDYPTDIVVADRRQAPAVLLRDHADWEYVYSDPVSVIFLRRGDAHAATLERFRAGELRYDDAALDTAFPGAFRGEADTPFTPTAACRLAGPPASGATPPDFC